MLVLLMPLFFIFFFFLLSAKVCRRAKNDGIISNRVTFKAITNAVCSCLSQMGDDALVLKILQKTVFNEMVCQHALHTFVIGFPLVIIIKLKLPRMF